MCIVLLFLTGIKLNSLSTSYRVTYITGSPRLLGFMDTVIGVMSLRELPQTRNYHDECQKDRRRQMGKADSATSIRSWGKLKITGFVSNFLYKYL